MQVSAATNLANFVSKLQDERYQMVFSISTKNVSGSSSSSESESEDLDTVVREVFAATDQSLANLVEWRDIKGHKL